MSRKSRLRRNLGGTVTQDDRRFSEAFFDGPQLAELRTSITLPERLLRAVLVSEIERLTADRAEAARFFAHLFDPTAAPDEHRDYVEHFLKNPPRTVLGYPRATGEWPIYAITLSSDEEDDEHAALGRYVSETQPGEDAPGGEDAMYEGGFFSQTNAILVMAPHPDQCLYLYHLAKMILFGARDALHAAGLISPHFSGGELNPNETVLPDNAFARVLNVSFTSMVTVPRLFQHRDGRRLRLAGIFGSDVVVDGMRGGVHVTATLDQGDDEDGC